MVALRARAAFSRLDDAGLRLGNRLLSPTAFVVAMVGYLAILFVIRGLLLSGVPNDDSEQLLYSQSFAWGYGLRNPPLYTWLVIAAEEVFGVTFAAPVAVKFLLLGATYLTLLASARRMTSDPRWAVAAAAAPLGLYYVAWDAVQNYSHTVLLVFVCAATHHCLLRLSERLRIMWYGLLGVAIGVGIVTKYNFLIFGLALIGAAATEPTYRSKLSDRRIVITVIVAAVIAAPYAIYALGHASGETGIPNGSSSGMAVSVSDALTTGFERFLSFGIGFLAPLAFLLPAFFPGAFKPLQIDAGRPGPAIRVAGLSLLIQAALFLLVAVAAYVVGVGGAFLHPHLFFTFIVAPLWFISRASYTRVSANALARFAVVLCVLAMAVPVVTLGKYVLDPSYTRRPVYNVPYAELADALKRAGFTEGTVFSWDQPFPLSGNLRVMLPGSRFISGKFPFYAPPARNKDGQCLVIWTDEANPGLETQVAASFHGMTGGDLSLAQQPSLISLPMVAGWGRLISFKYQLLKDGSGSCR